MPSTKAPKAQPIRSNDYTPKAGPKKPGFKGRKSGISSFNNQPTLMDAVRKDRTVGSEGRDAAAKRANLRRNFSDHQADRALAMINPSNNAIRVVAEQIIVNFRTAKPELATPLSPKPTSRTAVAIRMLQTQLPDKMLKNKNAMAKGKDIACKALSTAYVEIDKEIDDLASVPAQLVASF